MRILVATDLSEASDEAIRQAHARAGADDTFAACYVLSNFQIATAILPRQTRDAILDAEGHATRADMAVRHRIGTITGRAPESFEVFIEHGVDYAEVARRASDWAADLVVVGGHGSTGLRRSSSEALPSA